MRRICKILRNISERMCSYIPVLLHRYIHHTYTYIYIYIYIIHTYTYILYTNTYTYINVHLGHKKSDQTANKLVGGFIFLRFFNPAIVTPSSVLRGFNHPLPAVQRNLVMVCFYMIVMVLYMYVCVCNFVCVCMYIYVYVCLCMYVYVYTGIRMYVYVCMYIYVYVCLCMYARTVLIYLSLSF